jgi:hypothetical protein
MARPNVTETSDERSDHKLSLRFDRDQAPTSQVAAAVMEQVEVLDFSLSEPDLVSVVKQIHGGALQETTI